MSPEKRHEFFRRLRAAKIRRSVTVFNLDDYIALAHPIAFANA